MTRTIFIAAALALVVTLPIAPAQAQVNRTFLSAAGSDSNNCANVATPCRHFAAAYAVTAPSGEIFVLDPANYGSLTITHAVSIEGHGWASIAPPNNGNAITINAGSGDNISLHGLSINGTGATGGTNGIVFNSGGSLNVTDCMVQNFNGNGILIQPTSGTANFAITNITVLNSGTAGIHVVPQGNANTQGTIDGVTTNFDNLGMNFDGSQTTGFINFAVSGSHLGNNATAGIMIDSGTSQNVGIFISNTAFELSEISITGSNARVAFTHTTMGLSFGVEVSGNATVFSDGTNSTDSGKPNPVNPLNVW